ncbi:MAG: dihydroxyacetone kinase subunit DhaL [Lachnospiraceae bacterium]|nr:dihydroxyacetone kinase subunit DhaL [Lachnospiraceae bacterium]
MQDINVSKLQKALFLVCDKIIAAEPMLTELDTIIGDGDHGFGMRIGFSAMKKELSRYDYMQENKIPYDLFKDAGMALIRVMGGTSGVIFGTLFIGGLPALENRQTLTLTDLSEYISISTSKIRQRGRVEQGDKTMYDALFPASEALTASAQNGLSVEKAFEAAYFAAKEGAEKTKAMISRKGRSKNFRDKTLGHIDSGAVSTTLIFEALFESFSEQK